MKGLFAKLTHLDGKPQLGHQRLVRGPTNFFLQPGEKLADTGISSAFILAPEDALLVRAKEGFTEERTFKSVTKKTDRKPGGKTLEIEFH